MLLFYQEKQMVHGVIKKILKQLSLKPCNYELYYDKFAKLNLDNFFTKKTLAKLIVVTSINPTPTGEGKTTFLIGLVDAMNKFGYNTIGVLREPSVGPVFGMKGTATGGGQTCLTHEDDINLHFTGDLHAITTANNLISSIIENEIYFNTKLNIDEHKILWKRCLDINDRGLREININVGHDRFYTTGFNITAASDLMALFCLVNTIDEFKSKLEHTIVAYDTANQPITIHDLKIENAIMNILQQAFKPNLAYTTHANPVLIHGGPFANIAHGCNSLLATQMALQLSDYTITECGFGSDLGFEKLMNIKMQSSGLKPHLVIICLTIDGLIHHDNDMTKTRLERINGGFANLCAHVEHVRTYNLEPLVVLNIHASDNNSEIRLFDQLCINHKFTSSHSDMYIHGTKHAQSLVNCVIKNMQNTKIKLLYDVKKDSLLTKIENICQHAYHTNNIIIDASVQQILKQPKLQDYYICIAKTQYSLTSNPELLNYPDCGEIKINWVEINHAAKLVIPICGTIWKMPGLTKEPRAKNFKKID